MLLHLIAIKLLVSVVSLDFVLNDCFIIIIIIIIIIMKRKSFRDVEEIIERLSLTFTVNGKNETFAVSLQLCV